MRYKKDALKKQKEENEVWAKLNDEAHLEINKLVKQTLKENFDKHSTVSQNAQKDSGEAKLVVHFSKKTLKRLFENCDLQVSDKDCENLLEVIMERELEK